MQKSIEENSFYSPLCAPCSMLHAPHPPAEACLIPRPNVRKRRSSIVNLLSLHVYYFFK
jgi:hypothetical protein